MAEQQLSSDLIPSTLSSGGLVFSGDASSSLDCQLPKEQVDAALNSTVISANRIAELMQQFVGSIESKILDAFKQAASDVVEHVAKEAATRVVMAERKASELDQELMRVKQQALAMLLHMKRSADLRIAETERESSGERRRAEDAEGKLFIVQENLERAKNERKKQGAVIETMQKQKRGIRSSPWNDEEDGRNMEIKLDQPQPNMDKLLLFAGVMCEDANSPHSSFPSKMSAAANQSRSQALVFLPLVDEPVAKTNLKDPLKNGEQQVQQCDDLQNKKACVFIQERPLPNDLAGETSRSKEISFQSTEMQLLKSVKKQQMLPPSKWSRKSKATMKRRLNDFKPMVDDRIKEVDCHQIHPTERQNLDAHSAFESSGADSDNVCSCNVNMAEGQNAEILLPVRVSPDSKHVPSFSIMNVVVGDDYERPGLPYREFQGLENGSNPEYENPGTCSQAKIAETTEDVHSSLFCSEALTHANPTMHELCVGQSSLCCKECSLKCTNESSMVHLEPDGSEIMEVEQPLQSFAEGIEVPGCNLVNFKHFKEPAADGSSHSISPNMRADSNVSECGGVVDSINTRGKVARKFSGKGSSPSLSAIHDARIQQGQLNGHSKSKKQKKDGVKLFSEIPDVSLHGTCAKRPRGPPPIIQSGCSYPTVTESNHKSSEVQKPLSLAVESSRESRRLMQGARQLFLLAERKWH